MVMHYPENSTITAKTRIFVKRESNYRHTSNALGATVA